MCNQLLTLTENLVSRHESTDLLPCDTLLSTPGPSSRSTNHVGGLTETTSSFGMSRFSSPVILNSGVPVFVDSSTRREPSQIRSFIFTRPDL